jgi:glycerol-3-phosphate acyltransferase PlsY
MYADPKHLQWVFVPVPCLNSRSVAGIFTIFIFVRHRDNLKRLAAGKEPEFKLKKDQSASGG